MAKLTIRTIELDLDDGTLPDVARSIVSAAMNGHAHVQIAAAGEPLKLPSPSVQSYEVPDSKPAKVKRPYKRRVKAEVANGEPAKRLGRPPKTDHSPGNMIPAAPTTGDRLTDRIETLMMQAGRGVGTVYIAQKLPGNDLSSIKRALGQGCRHKRFVHDASDDTYSLAEVR